MSTELYLHHAIKEVERRWGNITKIASRQDLDVPVPQKYRPELDTTNFLNDDDTQLYQSYIGILRWAVELGRVDLSYVAGRMSGFSAAPREGHLHTLLRIFAYCKKHDKSKLVFDYWKKDWNNVNWVEYDWKCFYDNIKGETLPSNMPEPRGKSVQINLFCDAAHATCLQTRRSTTGFIFFLNGAPITWYSKTQNTLETSTFGNEFMGTKIAVKMNESIKYKLRMVGIPIDGPTNGFCDNKSVITNATQPHSTLTKKHNAIAYHKVRESVASKAIRIAHERGQSNLSDMLTKFIGSNPF